MGTNDDNKDHGQSKGATFGYSLLKIVFGYS